ncbi:MAG: CoA pyrophosphatase [Deltaproteobacteria bacterium]|jgi:8-oxo-dGTP pyrophosphatase MutT (NUDIX family)|nr:CoA pyrophosphatase [Deltaproteobacteria bacterium]MBW2519013.1 CoA pyrophosphatase [Deltaproteobacteria bacterium]
MSKFDLSIDSVRKQLDRYAPKKLAADRNHAAVAMILRDAIDGPELLFILRAAHDNDPWSGDIGFPGGRLDDQDAGARQAAERETLEELAIDLQNAEYLGRLDDLYGATLPILVSCFVYHLETIPAVRTNHEIEEIFWLPLSELLNPNRHLQATFDYRGQTICHPAVNLLGENRTVLWGITYRLIRNFYSLFKIDFGNGPVDVDARP